MEEYTLFIDDERSPKVKEYTLIARTSQEAIQIMEIHGCPKEISFDHDLGCLSETDGTAIADWMIERNLNTDGNFFAPEFSYNVHSANPVGVQNILGKLDGYFKFK